MSHPKAGHHITWPVQHPMMCKATSGTVHPGSPGHGFLEQEKKDKKKDKDKPVAQYHRSLGNSCIAANIFAACDRKKKKRERGSSSSSNGPNGT